MMDESAYDAEMETLIDEAISKLSEHFETVHILVSTSVDGVTSGYHRAKGNSCAIYGNAKRFVMMEEERFRQSVREEDEAERDE